MSYYRGGRRNNNRGHHDRHQSYIESPENQLKKTIFTLGEHPDADLDSEVRRVAAVIRHQGESMLDIVCKAIQVGVVEQPHKIPFLAALVGLLYVPLETSADNQDPDPIGQQILQSCWKSCKEATQDSELRHLRSWIQFFSQLTIMEVVAPGSLIQLIQNISQVLEELGASTKRLLKIVACIVDALIRAGKVLWEYDSSTVENLAKSVNASLRESVPNELTSPFLHLQVPFKHSPSVFESRIQITSVMDRLIATQFAESEMLYPLVKLRTVQSQSRSEMPLPFRLDSILLPPEQVDGAAVRNLVTNKSEGFPRFMICVYDNEITPETSSVVGYSIRTLIIDVVEAYGINRKEGAQVLVDLPRWLRRGIFFQPGLGPSDTLEGGKEAGWQLESTLIETLLSKLFELPNPSVFLPYFTALMCELCRLSPATFGPAVGKCFRRLYDMIGEGLDVEIVRRFGEWFAVHMSNFEFRWPWKEWSPALELPNGHPKKAFMRSALDIEIRLSYYDRILRSVPENFHPPSADVLPDQAPGPDFAYADPSHPHNATAQEILNWLQGRTDPAEVIKGMETHKERLIDTGENEAKALSILRQIVVQSLLEIGARSFSHFLNAVERYIKLMRHITADTDSSADILEAITMFWKKNPQMMLITFDKFMQYQFTEPSDHIAWAFRLNNGFISAFEWEIIRAALDKVNGRVFISQKKVDQLRKEQDDALALQKAQEPTDMETEVNLDMERPETTALTAALNSKEMAVAEQRRSLQITLEKFIETLSPVKSLFVEGAWERRNSWADTEYHALDTWGWFRHFCRTYAPQLTFHANDLRASFEAQLAGEKSQSIDLLRRHWTLALGES